MGSANRGVMTDYCVALRTLLAIKYYIVEPQQETVKIGL